MRFLPVCNQNVSNLAWEFIQGFVHLWNQMDLGTGSLAEGLKFTMIGLNLTKILENEFKNRNHTGGNTTWGIIESHFLERKEGQPWKSNRTWTEHTKALYQLPSDTTWGELGNQTRYPSYNVTSVPVPCIIVLWWDSPSEGSYFEHEYNIRWNADQCIHIPDKPGEIHLIN